MWQIEARSCVTTVTGHRQGAPSAPWEEQQQTAIGLDVISVVQQVTDLLHLSPAVITRFLTGTDGPTAEALLEAMEVVDVDRSNTAWPDSVDVPWDEDVDIDAFYPNIEWQHVWAMIDDIRVTSLRTEIDGQPVLVPVMLDLDSGDGPEWHPVELISESAWVNDDSGAPVIWQGWNNVLRLSGRVAVEIQRGDDGREDNLLILSGP